MTILELTSQRILLNVTRFRLLFVCRGGGMDGLLGAYDEKLAFAFAVSTLVQFVDSPSAERFTIPP